MTEILLINAGLITLAMLGLWLLSVRMKDASIVDIFWGAGFAIVAVATYMMCDRGPRAGILTLLASLWGIRLSGYLAYRNHGKGEDKRYAAMREQRGDSFRWFSLISVFGLQGVVMWLVSLPIQVGQTTEVPFGILNGLGIILWLIGFLFEAIGDFQLARFKSDPDNDAKVMDRGLWRYTRHPNYFGNATLWWGLTLIALSWSTIWLMLSPILMTFLLLKVSGVALLERDLAGRSAEYRDYVERTSAFFPWPPKSDR